MNAVNVQKQGNLWARVVVYGLLPVFCFGLCLGIVVLQFVVSATVFPEESLPLYSHLSLVYAAHRDFSELPSSESEEGDSTLLIGDMELPTEMLSVLPGVPKGAHPIVTTTISLGSGLINATEYRADISVQASALPAPSEEEGPLVLVLHTHATESFFDPDESPVQTIVAGQSKEVFGYYEEGLSPRSNDETKNMVSVGERFCATLEEMGIPTVHCKTLHDLDYSQAYANSLASAEEYLKTYPSIRYIIDLHRDSLVRDDGTKLKPTCVLDGENVAQVMLVVGAGSSDLAQPNWKENLATAARYQSYLSDVSPSFTRPVYLRYGRFNQHLSAQTMLLEVGSCGNTLEEALRAGEHSARALGNMILDSKG